MLSEKDKERIWEEALLREEVRSEVAGAVHPRPERRKRDLYGVLNSPLFIAIVAGFALNLASKLIVSANAENERRASKENALREKKMAIISSVANDLATYESERVSWLKRKVWLATHQKEDDKREGVPRATVERDCLEFWKLLMQARKPA